MKKIFVLFLLLIFSNCAFVVNSYNKYGSKTGSYKKFQTVIIPMINTEVKQAATKQIQTAERPLAINTDKKQAHLKTNSSGRTTQYDKYGRVESYK